LRLGDPPIVARTHGDAIAFDVRTIGNEEFPIVEHAARAVLEQTP
jgi:hypothetical protein